MVSTVMSLARVPRASDLARLALLATVLALPPAPARGLWVGLSEGQPFSDVPNLQGGESLSFPRWAVFDHDSDAALRGVGEVIFLDGFELGDPFAWSAVVGFVPPQPQNISCEAATNLGTVEDSQATGPIQVNVMHQVIPIATSRWYKVLATDSFGNGWKLLAKVSGIPAGRGLDLFAYRRADGNDCTSPPAVIPALPESCNENISGCGGSQENSNRCSLESSNSNECVSWFEACSGFAENDQTVIWIEVRHVAGEAAVFDLTLRNNGDNDNFTCANF